MQTWWPAASSLGSSGSVLGIWGVFPDTKEFIVTEKLVQGVYSWPSGIDEMKSAKANSACGLQQGRTLWGWMIAAGVRMVQPPWS